MKVTQIRTLVHTLARLAAGRIGRKTANQTSTGNTHTANHAAAGLRRGSAAAAVSLQRKGTQKTPNKAAHQPPEPEYDVFISHAWEDKKPFVNQFVDELRTAGVKVWYDTNELQWGDPMREKIEEGLRKSRFAIVVLSPDYIKEGKYWTKAELDGLFQLESMGRNRLLPIWHNLTQKDVTSYSSFIANKMALKTADMSSAEIAEELKSILLRAKQEEDRNP